MAAVAPSYRGFRYPAEVISHCVWLYHRFLLSFGEVEEIMMERGVVVSCETIRQWCQKFGQIYANGCVVDGHAQGIGRREAVVGDEAHIAARSLGGPRYGECPPGVVDSYENLILLCRVDHKKVDDQAQHYTTARLRQAKTEHETWVKHTLGDVPAPIRIQLNSDNPAQLQLMNTASDVWEVVQETHRILLEDLDEDTAGPGDLGCSATFLRNARDSDLRKLSHDPKTAPETVISNNLTVPPCTHRRC